MTDLSVCCTTKAIVLPTVSNFLFRPHPSSGEEGVCFSLSFNKKEFQDFLKVVRHLEPAEPKTVRSSGTTATVLVPPSGATCLTHPRKVD